MASIRKKEGKTQIWDQVRRRWINYSPEEGVRQWLIELLVARGVEYWRMATEVPLEAGGRRLRIDILVYSKESKPIMICECKAPEIHVDDATFLQAANYNQMLSVPYLTVTNGKVLYCAKVDVESGECNFLDSIPPL